MSVAAWTALGFFTQVAFAVTAATLVVWLSGLLHPPGSCSPGACAQDILLAVQFGVLHSVLLLPRVRQRLTQYVPGPLYGCFFCAATCISLLVTLLYWRSFGPVFWDVHAVWWAYVPYGFSWAALLYSIWISGAGYQTGWTPFWAWLRGRRLPPRTVPDHVVYRCLRHPIYLSFLCILWTPVLLTADRLLLNVVWTIYVFIGSYLKDERLAHYLGASYREYQRRVPGYPFFPVGPLARLH